MSVDAAADIWREKSDEELLKAADRLHDYLPEGQEIILAEVSRRGLSLDRPETAPAASRLATPRRNPIAKLWAGEYSLPFTYWICGWVLNAGIAFVLIVVIDLGTTSLAMARIAQLLALVWMAYQVMVLVGIWRSAGRYTGPQVWATLARAAVASGTAISVVRLVAAFVAA